MASSPKIRVTIPKSLNLTASEKSSLKKAFQSDVVQVLKKHETGVRNDIINIIPGPGPSSKRKAVKKASKKSGKKK